MIWIPVSNRLPSDDEMKLVTCETKKGVKNVNRAYYSEGSWHGSGSMSGVIAWSAMPKPYDGTNEDDRMAKVAQNLLGIFREGMKQENSEWWDGYLDALVDALNYIKDAYPGTLAADEVEELMRRNKDA